MLKERRMEIRYLTRGRDAEECGWDQFVRASEDGTAFHLTAWKRVVEAAFGHRPCYMMACEQDEIRAVLPLFEVRGLLSGRVLTSVPYAVYGGLCGADTDARRALLDAARDLARGRRARHVELRHLHRAEPELPTKSRYATFAKPLDEVPDVNFSRIPGKQRRMIRQGVKNGLEARRGWASLEAFYEIYLRNRRRLGSPPFPRRLFESVRDHFGKESELLTVWHKDRMVSGVVTLFYEGRVMPYYGAALPAALPLAANDFMYWEVMAEASRAGYRIFDFGRSREGSGSYDFKRHWGFVPAPLSYQFVLVNGEAITDLSPSNVRFRLFIEAWKRLPLRATRWLGPMLTRRLPLD
jgi:FemAB-related protein (PEP-CTERM system-associated)